MADAFRYHRQGRSLGTLAVVILIWLAFLAARVWLDASWVILATLALFTLPALWDVIKNPSAGLTLTDRTLDWHSGRHTARINLSEIDRVRLDTRLDFSVRATVILRTGRKIRLPFEATPPNAAFETALARHDIKTERHHFSLRQ